MTSMLPPTYVREIWLVWCNSNRGIVGASRELVGPQRLLCPLKGEHLETMCKQAGLHVSPPRASPEVSIWLV